MINLGDEVEVCYRGKVTGQSINYGDVLKIQVEGRDSNGEQNLSIVTLESVKAIKKEEKGC